MDRALSDRHDSTPVNITRHSPPCVGCDNIVTVSGRVVCMVNSVAEPSHLARDAGWRGRVHRVGRSRVVSGPVGLGRAGSAPIGLGRVLSGRIRSDGYGSVRFGWVPDRVGRNKEQPPRSGDGFVEEDDRALLELLGKELIFNNAVQHETRRLIEVGTINIT